jgi:hypothetical protein
MTKHLIESSASYLALQTILGGFLCNVGRNQTLQILFPVMGQATLCIT